MKMRTVIEAGRSVSPLINEGLSEMRAKLDHFGQLLEDLSSVKSEEGRRAILEECHRGLDSLSGSLVDATSRWNGFDSSLRSYKYRFRKSKKEMPADLPGQQFLFYGQS